MGEPIKCWLRRAIQEQCLPKSSKPRRIIEGVLESCCPCAQSVYLRCVARGLTGGDRRGLMSWCGGCSSRAFYSHSLFSRKDPGSLPLLLFGTDGQYDQYTR